MNIEGHLFEMRSGDETHGTGRLLDHIGGGYFLCDVKDAYGDRTPRRIVVSGSDMKSWRFLRNAAIDRPVEMPDKYPLADDTH